MPVITPEIAQQTLEFLKFVPKHQIATVKEMLDGEESSFFSDKINELGKTIMEMPVTYEQDGKGDDAIVYLHYFSAACDWWITEKDVEGGVQQAFGLASLNGNRPELGYISILGLVALTQVEIDFHWTPKTLREVKNGR